MDNYIAAIFDTKERAEALNAALLQLHHDGVRLKYAGVYGRGPSGSVQLEGSETSLGGFLDTLPSAMAGEQEALDELSEKLPAASYALLAHVIESDPSVIDGMVAQYGGTINRRTRNGLESAGFDRFIDSTSM